MRFFCRNCHTVLFLTMKPRCGGVERRRETKRATWCESNQTLYKVIVSSFSLLCISPYPGPPFPRCCRRWRSVSPYPSRSIRSFFFSPVYRLSRREDHGINDLPDQSSVAEGGRKHVPLPSGLVYFFSLPFVNVFLPSRLLNYDIVGSLRS